MWFSLFDLQMYPLSILAIFFVFDRLYIYVWFSSNVVLCSVNLSVAYLRKNIRFIVSKMCGIILGLDCLNVVMNC